MLKVHSQKLGQRRRPLFARRSGHLAKRTGLNEAVRSQSDASLELMIGKQTSISEFTNKVAIVTGATSGIGRATTIAFARAGAKVVTARRRGDEGNELVNAIRQAGGEAAFVKTDVSSESDVKALPVIR